MRTALSRGGVGVAALAVAASSILVASPASAAPGEGTLTVTWFEDRYTDGVYDTTPTNPAGEKDQLRQSGNYLYLQTADDAWYGAPQRADGTYVFPDVPMGEADLYVVDPTGTNQNAFWDATEGDPEFMPQSNVSFDNGTFLHEDGTRTTGLSGPGSSAGRLTVNIGDETTTNRLVGMAGIGANAEVTVDGERTTGLAELTFFENGAALPATEWDTGRFFAARDAGQAKLVPGEIGIGVELLDTRRYRIESVTAGSNIDTTLSIPLTQNGGIWTMDSADLVRYFDSVEFTVALAPVPLTDLTVTYFDDNVLDGVFDPTLESPAGVGDEKREATYAYLQDASGQWWATTANAEGDFFFDDVPAGAGTLHLGVPAMDVLAVWDATDLTDYTDLEVVEQGPISFTGGTDVSAGAGTPIDADNVLTAAVPVVLAEGEDVVEAGAASVFQFANVVTESGEGFYDAEITLLANDTSLPTPFDDGVYYAAATLAPALYGIAATAPAGFQIVDVQAFSWLTDEELVVTGAAASAASGTWRVTPEQLGDAFDGVEWRVTVAPLPATPGDGGQPGTGAAGGTKDALASTGADSTGATIAGLSALLLLLAGAGALLIRRRTAQ